MDNVSALVYELASITIRKGKSQMVTIAILDVGCATNIA